MIIVLAVVIASALGTGIVRHYALTQQVLDIPNERSSHVVPTPRGGGVAIVVPSLGAVAVLTMLHMISTRSAIAFVGGGAIVAAAGFLDDHRPLAPGWRLLCHFAAAAWALAWLGGMPPVTAFGGTVNLGIGGDILTLIALVWLLNLYNFMDGIDGIAAAEAVTVCLGAMLLYSLAGIPRAEIALAAVFGAAALGFLLWNWPPAKIFMGDAGSGFLGLMLGLLALRGATLSAQWIWSWAILLGAFVVDATVTLFRRIRRGERPHEAHRSHAYQHAALRIGRHGPVTLTVSLLNLAWLLPWALLVGLGRVSALVGVTAAYAPLVWLVLRLDAGVPVQEPAERR